MKKFYYLSLAFLAAMCCVSCADSDDNDENGINGSTARTDVVDYTLMFYSCGGANLDTDTERNWAAALDGLENNDPNVRYMVQFKYSGEKNLKQYNPTHT